MECKNDKLYHITKKKYLLNILNSGLNINTKHCSIGSKYNRIIKAYGIKPIYLTENYKKTAKECLTKTWIDKYEPYVLYIYIKDLKLINEYKHVNWCHIDFNNIYTWICLNNISKNRIIKVKKLIKPL